MVQSDISNFLKLHQEQLLRSGVPQKFWNKLYLKLKNEIFDSSVSFSLLKFDYENERKPEDPLWAVQVNREDGIKCDDENHIYLIDHAWTFRINSMRSQLLENDSLLDRLSSMMGIDNVGKDEQVTSVCRLIWKHCNTYTVGNAETAEDRVPIWYIMDELGFGICHSNNPNFRAVPFIYVPQGISYTLIFPIKDIEFGGFVTRDYVEGTTNFRAALLVPWFPNSFKDVDFKQEEPDESYFFTGRSQETLPVNQNILSLPETFKIFTEYDLIRQYLKDPRFIITEDENEADILWLTRSFKSYGNLSPNKLINQFPFEHLLTVKDLLSVICRRKNPKWLPITYNLNTELNKFISLFRFRLKNNLDNHWICKPWNLARALDTYVTNNIDQIIRLTESGPKIAQKYIECPVTFTRPECDGSVKFDIRYVILLKSVRPLTAYVYKNFFLRFANKKFELKDLDDYEKHFTVMNYRDTKLCHMPCAEFIPNWTEQYPDQPWDSVEENIIVMLREMLEAATCKEPPQGIHHNVQSRALYAADIMLSWDDGVIQPKLLEVNWIPDCKRACQYYPDFYDKIFQLLFLDIECEDTFKRL